MNSDIGIGGRFMRAPLREGMAKRKKAEHESSNGNGTNGGGLAELTKELWQAAVNLRGSIEPADYKRYVLPIIFLRFLSLRYECRREELEAMIADSKSENHTADPKVAAQILEDPDEYAHWPIAA
jgi:type I restriction-modification system DNA methylase subunit